MKKIWLTILITIMIIISIVMLPIILMILCFHKLRVARPACLVRALLWLEQAQQPPPLLSLGAAAQNFSQTRSENE